MVYTVDYNLELKLATSASFEIRRYRRITHSMETIKLANSTFRIPKGEESMFIL